MRGEWKDAGTGEVGEEVGEEEDALRRLMVSLYGKFYV